MQNLIEKAIREEAQKRLSRHSLKCYIAKKHQKLFEKRTGRKARSTKGGTPKSWAFDKHFDPRYCIGHAEFLAKGIWNSLKTSSYTPRTALRTGHRKPDGTMRYIDAFSIPDAAIASIFIRNLRKRNAKIFSDCSFAYQENKTPLDAVLKVRSMLGAEKIFISQYDFSRFFDNINHNHIHQTLSKESPFLTTHMERAALQATIVHKYSIDGIEETRQCGTPQGNSLSLFISNAAAHCLDAELSKTSGLFARFADDSVVVNYNYEDALKSAEIYRKFSSISGVPINAQKSSGIRLLSEKDAEMRAIGSFNFLSYKFTPSEVLVSEKTVSTIKAKCARTIYRHLLMYPKKTNRVALRRITGPQYDWDLITCLNELRNYIYGGRSESEIREYLSDDININNLQGAVSYFSLVEKSDQFRSLDGWLADAVQRAMAERVRIIRLHTSMKSKSFLTNNEVIDGSWYKASAISLEARLPSFYLAWRAGRKSLLRHGLGGIDAIGMGYSYS